MKRKGFTLIEMVLVGSLTIALLGMSAPLYQQLQSGYDLDSAIQLTVSAARSASHKALSSQDDSQWSVHIQTGTVTLFKGVSFAARDTTYDDVFPISSGLSISGSTDYVFQKMNGFAQNTGTLTYTNVLQQSKTITINEKAILF